MAFGTLQSYFQENNGNGMPSCQPMSFLFTPVSLLTRNDGTMSGYFFNKLVKINQTNIIFSLIN